MHPDAAIIREVPVGDGPTRRTVYRPRTGGRYEREEQIWRASIADWHTVGTELLDELCVDVPEAYE